MGSRRSWTDNTILKKATANGQATTPQSFATAAGSGALHAFLLGQSATVNRNGKTIPNLPSVCSATGLLGVYRNGKVTDLQPVDPSALISG